MKKIMIAVDLSSNSSKVVSTGMELARTGKSGVILLNVINLLDAIVPEYGEAMDARVEQAKNKLEQIKEVYPGIETETQVILGKPENILEEAGERQAALLVIGTNGHTGLKHFFLGSTAELLIRHASIPVLVVPYNEVPH